jgi:hypothetical protein
MSNEKKQNQSEMYLMANRNPWLVWRLKALDAGHVPPLLPGRIPPEMAQAAFGNNEETYEPDVLAKHARWFTSNQRRLIRRGFTVCLIGFLLVATVAFLYVWKVGNDYRFGLIDSLLPRIERTQPPQKI